MGRFASAAILKRSIPGCSARRASESDSSAACRLVERTMWERIGAEVPAVLLADVKESVGPTRLVIVIGSRRGALEDASA